MRNNHNKKNYKTAPRKKTGEENVNARKKDQSDNKPAESDKTLELFVSSDINNCKEEASEKPQLSNTITLIYPIHNKVIDKLSKKDQAVLFDTYDGALSEAGFLDEKHKANPGSIFNENTQIDTEVLKAYNVDCSDKDKDNKREGLCGCKKTELKCICKYIKASDDPRFDLSEIENSHKDQKSPWKYNDSTRIFGLGWNDLRLRLDYVRVYLFSTGVGFVSFFFSLLTSDSKYFAEKDFFTMYTKLMRDTHAKIAMNKLYDVVLPKKINDDYVHFRAKSNDDTEERPDENNNIDEIENVDKT